MTGRNNRVTGVVLTDGPLIPREDTLRDTETGRTEGRRAPFALAASALGGRRALVKRGIDVVGATIALVLISPLLATLAALVKLDSRGPVLFTQMRVGLEGRPFRMLELRTMRDGADAARPSLAHLSHTDDPRLFKIPRDPRVTRVGRMVQRWSLGEPPQLVNVLRGDMSLVAPRPFFESDLADYEAHHFRRLAMKPGITGLWQVSGPSEIVDSRARCPRCSAGAERTDA